ncbi:hypothetical protein [Acidocella sp. KAb 2-4]|uniref:hypothetical protein n=1 Tax=Acidocella sp. KAb 2-4 TaxID=2885158 RepID=UPI001D08B500|nr:hypothetical protein [Acidocella sp. KAb 2-4]MCB5944235.1 hypothetical protein [Acidocella sp. KAb 2-4]
MLDFSGSRPNPEKDRSALIARIYPIVNYFNLTCCVSISSGRVPSMHQVIDEK